MVHVMVTWSIHVSSRRSKGLLVELGKHISLGRPTKKHTLFKPYLSSSAGLAARDSSSPCPLRTVRHRIFCWYRGDHNT
jgi:hypothetical protein